MADIVTGDGNNHTQTAMQSDLWKGKDCNGNKGSKVGKAQPLRQIFL